MRGEAAVLAISVMIALAWSGCTYPQGEYNPSVGFCGDGLCSYEEKTSCNADCSPALTPGQPTELNWLEETRKNREQNQAPPAAGNASHYGPVTPDPNTPPIIVDKPIESALPEKGFRVASRYNLLSIGENITGVMGTLTGAHLREILRGGSLRSNFEAFGPKFSFYEQYLLLKSGKVVFGYDEETETPSTYLEYKEGEPILEYNLRLNNGIFKFFEGEQINFLGHTYAMTEISNNSIVLVGTNTQDIFRLRHLHGSIIDGNDIPLGVLTVNMSKDYLKITVGADEDMKILPGQKLTDYVSRLALLTNRLDLTYLGLTESPSINLHLRRSGGNYRLTFQNNLGANYTAPIAQLGPLRFGNDDHNFIFAEGVNTADYNIAKKDYFIINNGREQGGITTLLQLSEVDYIDGVVSFQDPALEKFYVTFSGNVSAKNANGDLLVYGVNHKVYVGPNQTISVDLNGDGRISKATIPIVFAGNSMLKMSKENNTILLKFIIPGQLRENGKSDLETRIILDDNGIRINASSLAMEFDQVHDTLVGITDFGTILLLKKNVETREQRGTDLLINQPLSQRFAEVILQAYE